MARCETGAAAGRRVGGEGGIGLKLKSADGGVLLVVNMGSLKGRGGRVAVRDHEGLWMRRAWIYRLRH